jgi:hypothetical protein
MANKHLPKKPTTKVIKLKLPKLSSKEQEVNDEQNETEYPQAIVLPGVTVLGRTTEQSGSAIVVEIDTAGHSCDAHYSVDELLKDRGGPLAIDLAKAGHVGFTHGKELRSIANEILRQGSASETIVLDATGLISLTVNGGSYQAYVWNGCAHWFGATPPIQVIASKIATKLPVARTLKGWRIHVGRRLRRNPYLIVLTSHGLAAALRRVFQQPVLVTGIIGPSSQGKSTGQRLVASMYTAPGNQVGVLQMAGTEVGIYEQLESCADRPICFQDLRQFASVEGFMRLVFSSADGATRVKHRTPPRQLSSSPIISNERGVMDISTRNAGSLDEGLFARYIELMTDGPFGMFHYLHGAKDAKEFAESLSAATEKYHGTVWPAWLQALSENWQWVLDRYDRWSPLLRKKIAAYAGDDELSAVDNRMLDGLVFSAWAGVIASILGILPLKPSEVRDAFGLVFAEHINRRRTGNTPLADKVIAEVRGYIDAHSGRFPVLKWFDGEESRSSISGYQYNLKNIGKVYLFHTNFFQETFVAKHGSIVYQILQRAGFLCCSKGRGNQYQVRIPGSGLQKSFIAVKAIIRYD